MALISSFVPITSHLLNFLEKEKPFLIDERNKHDSNMSWKNQLKILSKSSQTRNQIKSPHKLNLYKWILSCL